MGERIRLPRVIAVALRRIVPSSGQEAFKIQLSLLFLWKVPEGIFVVLDQIITQLWASRNLSEEQITLAVEALVDETVSSETKAEFLMALARKGETVEEITVFARRLIERSIALPLDQGWREAHEVLDVCGTGGDRLNTFNISTTVAIICASGGVAVAKHGNRAITSQAGSADVLEALGVRIDLPPSEAARSLREQNFAFLFAPAYHPVFKHLAPARKLCAARGQRTIFNFLGPLLNPVRPTVQLVGVARPELCEPLARVLQSLGARRAMVVSGTVANPTSTVPAAFLDELSTLGENTVAEFYHERGFSVSTLAPGHFPVQDATLADLAGGDRETNADIVRRLLAGEDRGPRRDAVLLNAAAAFFVAGRVRALLEGWEFATHLLEQGFAARKLGELATGRVE